MEMKRSKSILLYGVLCTLKGDLVAFASDHTATINKAMHFFSFDLTEAVEDDFIIDTVWFSRSVSRWFRFNQKIKLNKNIDSIVIGICQNTEVGIWSISKEKSYLLNIDYGEDVNDFVESFSSIDIERCFEWDEPDSNDNTRHYLQNLHHNLKQYNYRYCIVFGGRNGNENMCYDVCQGKFQTSVCVEEILFDGTHDKSHDNVILEYHKAGKPKKLAVKWHMEKSDYSAYFWFDEEGMREVFHLFYADYPESKTDFLIRIDVEQKKYELSLYKEGLRESQVIPINVYQVLVFKNQIEDYRSENYNQEPGAWIW